MQNAVLQWTNDPRSSIAALAEGGKQLHVGWLHLPPRHETSARPSGQYRERATRVLRDAAEILELHEVLCAFFEAKGALGSEAFRDVNDVHRIAELCHALTGLDVGSVLRSGERFFPKADTRTKAADHAADESSERSPDQLEDDLLGVASSAVAFCEMKDIDDVAESIGRRDLAHRCRLAREWLRSFVFRRGAPQAEQIKAAGHAYAQGRLSIQEVATVIGVSVDEALILLEQYGYFRAGDAVRLLPDERKKVLSRLRAERLARDGAPSLDRSLVVREVVSSHRIEDLDARPWLPK